MPNRRLRPSAVFFLFDVSRILKTCKFPVARDLKYISNETYQDLRTGYDRVIRMLSRLSYSYETNHDHDPGSSFGFSTFRCLSSWITATTTPSRLAGRLVQTVSGHLAKLRAADVVRYDSVGKEVRYCLEHHGETRALLKALERVVHAAGKVS